MRPYLSLLKFSSPARSRRLNGRPLGRCCQRLLLSIIVDLCLFHFRTLCYTHGMDIHVLNRQWLADHHTQISTWSPFLVLSSICLNVPIFTRHPLRLYRSIEANGGFTNDIQHQVIRNIMQHCAPIAAFADHFIQIYSTHDMSSRAYNDRPLDRTADAAARTLVVDFQALLDEHLPAVAPSSRSLADGTYGFTGEFQQVLLRQGFAPVRGIAM